MKAEIGTSLTRFSAAQKGKSISQAVQGMRQVLGAFNVAKHFGEEDKRRPPPR